MYMTSYTLEELGRVAEAENNELAKRIFTLAVEQIDNREEAIKYWEGCSEEAHTRCEELDEEVQALSEQCSSREAELDVLEDHITALKARIDELTHRLEGLEK